MAPDRTDRPRAQATARTGDAMPDKGPLSSRFITFAKGGLGQGHVIPFTLRRAGGRGGLWPSSWREYSRRRQSDRMAVHMLMRFFQS